MVNNSGTDVSSGNIGSGNTFATGLTGSDSRQCNDAKFSKAAIAAVGLPWTTPDVLNFLCNTVGATRQGNCTDITNPEKFAVNLSGKTGVAVKNLLIKTAGYNFFADYASNKLLQYEYWQATALANTFDGSTVCGTDSSTPLTIAGDGVMSISLLQKNGTTKTFMYKYDPNAVLGFWDGFNGTNTQHNCSYAVSKVNQLAADPAVQQLYKKSVDGGYTTPTPPNGQLPSAGSSTGTTTCAIDGIGWIVCPVMKFVGTVSDGAYGFISSNFLNINVNLLKPTLPDGSANPTYSTWGVFRSIANVLFVICVYDYCVFAIIIGWHK